MADMEVDEEGQAPEPAPESAAAATVAKHGAAESLAATADKSGAAEPAADKGSAAEPHAATADDGDAASKAPGPEVKAEPPEPPASSLASGVAMKPEGRNDDDMESIEEEDSASETPSFKAAAAKVKARIEEKRKLKLGSSFEVRASEVRQAKQRPGAAHDWPTHLPRPPPPGPPPRSRSEPTHHSKPRRDKAKDRSWSTRPQGRQQEHDDHWSWKTHKEKKNSGHLIQTLREPGVAHLHQPRHRHRFQ